MPRTTPPSAARDALAALPALPRRAARVARIPAVFAVLLAFAALAGGASAQDVFQEGTTVTLELMNGDRITGILEDADGARIVLFHDVLGRLSIARAAIRPTAPEPTVDPVVPWGGKFDLALSGSSGNTDNQSFRAGVDMKREDEETADSFVIWWRRAEASDIVTEEKGFTQFRREWKRGGRWRPFAQGSFEVDKFTDYDGRLAVAGGGAYQFRDGPVHKVSGRVGGGVSRKIDPNDPTVDKTTLEALLGLDWFWELDDISRFSLVADIYPSLSNAGEGRSVARLGWERKAGEHSPWYWKLGVDHFWDSEPGAGKTSSDLNYYLGLGRDF